jgi:hypothetical protein
MFARAAPSGSVHRQQDDALAPAGRTCWLDHRSDRDGGLRRASERCRLERIARSRRSSPPLAPVGASADPCHAQCAVAARRHVGVRQQPRRLRRGPSPHRAVRLGNGSQRRPGSTDQRSKTHRCIGQLPIDRFRRRCPSRSVRSCQDDGRDSLRSAELEQGGITGGEARRCPPGDPGRRAWSTRARRPARISPSPCSKRRPEGSPEPSTPLAASASTG